MEAIILAGGRGTRLQTVVPDRPKPLALVGGRPFLSLLLGYLARQGFRRVHLSVGYCRQAIMDTIGRCHGGIDVNYVTEEFPLGTGGALRKALSEASDSPVFALNGDTFFALDYQAMLAQHRETGAKLTVALRHIADTSRYGRVEVEKKRIISFREKGEAGGGWINGGIYLLNQDIFAAYELPETFSFEQDFLQQYPERLAPHAFLSAAYFIDIGIPEDYQRAQEEIPHLLLGS
ncbi:MAG: nucleotidyltransferase family protein [Sulfuricella sp.]|nr:nucleotidyltransferase family protein [Sulfuricella sp.]